MAEVSGVTFAEFGRVAIRRSTEPPNALDVVSHHLSRKIPGSGLPLELPLCWDMEGRQRGATDDEWMISWDHEAIDPESLWFAIQGEPTCRDCLEWMHA